MPLIVRGCLTSIVDSLLLFFIDYVVIITTRAASSPNIVVHKPRAGQTPHKAGFAGAPLAFASPWGADNQVILMWLT